MSNAEPQTDIDVLFVDDDPDFREIAARHFRQRGYRVEEAEDGQEALRLAGQRAFDVAILDMIMPGLSGLELIERLKAGSNDCEVILLTGEGTIQTAVEAMKLGAQDYLTKPVRLAELEVSIQKAHEAGRLRKENRQLRAVLRRSRKPWSMIGDSPAMQEVFRLIGRAGPTDKPILIQGESGTGKELVAHALHEASPLADKPLVVINCAALSETLLESELFGHEKGAFTGAVSFKPGLFEVADGGTLLIDEIGEMTGTLQVKLLRVLEDGSLRRVGSVKQRRVSVRLLAATNRDMAEELKAGRFREDLYYRINVMTLVLPPLRERQGDVPLLVQHFVGPDWQIEQDAIDALDGYHWPGNVRQLSNAIDRAKIMSDDLTIRLESLPPEIREHVQAQLPAAGSDADLTALKKAHIVEVLRREQGNKTTAAEALGVSRRSLYRLLEKFEIEV